MTNWTGDDLNIVDIPSTFIFTLEKPEFRKFALVEAPSNKGHVAYSALVHWLADNGYGDLEITEMDPWKPCVAAYNMFLLGDECLIRMAVAA